MLSNAFNILLMIMGFGFIIAIHELGHFLAARWAGIRVHAFAIGFGSALFSWRKGLGLRRGSSEREYNRLHAQGPASNPGHTAKAISPTEYRLNWFPFGGYVKMMGQEDLSAIEAPTAPDSFSAKPVWKRMVVISAGVAMNLLLAGVLFFIAFKVGILEAAPIIGDLAPDQPAEKAGLQRGDVVLTANGASVHTFNDLAVASVLSSPRDPLILTVQREGEPAPRSITVIPELGPTGLNQIGAYPAPAATLYSDQAINQSSPAEREQYRAMLQQAGMGELQPGMRLTAVNGAPIPTGKLATALPLRRAIETSGGSPVRADFTDDAGRQVTISIQPRPALQRDIIKREKESFAIRHLLGLTPVMVIEQVEEAGAAQGLLAGDIIARVGDVDWPNSAQGISAIRARKGQSIPLTLIRDGARIEISAKVNARGRIGFAASDTAPRSTILAAPPATETPTAAARIVPGIIPGSRITHIDGAPVANFADIRAALLAARSAAIPLTIELPIADRGDPVVETITLNLTDADTTALRALTWEGDAAMAAFPVAEFLDIATGPVDAVLKGVMKTHNVIMTTYATFIGLFQRTIPVDQLQGPIGITHLGSRVAERGYIYLLFFLGLISANLAVVNFLPLPITDGGHMVFLAIEGITRKPVSVAVQNIATMIGLVIIGTVFIMVTFNDIARLLGLVG